MNIVVPLAGKDDSFINVFGDLKSFIDIKGTPLIEFVLRCLPFRLDKVIFVCLKEDERRFGVSTRLKRIFGFGIRVIFSEKITEGSACSILLAEELINTQEDLLIDLADVYFEPLSLKSDIEEKEKFVKGVIPICKNTIQSKPWGYVYLNRSGFVEKVTEKEVNPSCENATLGLYYFSKGQDFVKYVKLMVKNNLRVDYNKLFYVAPVYNLFIKNRAKIGISNTKILHLLGSPKEAMRFMNREF